MNVTKVKNQMRMQEWAKLVEAREESGLSIKQWCKQNDLQEAQYYYYLRKLRLAACENLPVETSKDLQFTLVPNPVRDISSVSSEQSNIKITFPSAIVEIGHEADEAQIRLKLEVLLRAQ